MPDVPGANDWTEQGPRSAADTVDRYEAAESDLAQRGVTIKDMYWTVGPCDLVTVFEAADEETLSAGLLRLAAAGNLRRRRCAFTADEMRSVLERVR